MRGYSFQCMMACVCAAGVAFTSTAEARPNRHGAHRATVHHVKERHHRHAYHSRHAHHGKRLRAAGLAAGQQAQGTRAFADPFHDDQRGFLRRDAQRRAHQHRGARASYAARSTPAAGEQASAKRVTAKSSHHVASSDGASAYAYAGEFAGGGSSEVVAVARRYIGGNPTGRRSLWCGRFMNFVLERSGHQGTGSDLARSFAHYGRRISGPRVGAIAVMSRRHGGHVGVVSGIDEHGNPIIISGNHNHRVAEAVYPRHRIYAYVMPN